MSLSFLGPLIGAALGARPKHHRRAASFLGAGSSSFLNARSLLGLAGLATAAYYALRTNPGASSSAAPPIVDPGTTVLRAPSASTSTSTSTTPPPLPPPLPARELVQTPFVQRVLRLVVSAARADGAIGEQERAAILREAREIGAEALLEAELARPRPLAEIVAGVSDPAEKEALYTLAFGIVRADQDVNGAERVFLVQLANLLALDASRVQQLERDAAARIDAQP